MVKSVGYIILLLLLLGGILSSVGGSQKQVFDGIAGSVQANPGLLSRSEALELSGAINDMSKSERVIYLADVAENNIERVYQVENVLTKFVKDAKSVAHTSDFTEFFEALENVRSLKRFSHMFTHIDELRDLWPDVNKLNRFLDDLVENEGLFNLLKNADVDNKLRYSKAWNHLDLAESGSKVDPAVITKLADDILDNPALETFLEGGVGIVKAWEALVNTELRTNINWLENVKEWIDEGLEFTSTTTKVTIKKVGVEVGEISEDLLKVKYPHFGGDMICHQTKTTTAIGRWSGGTEDLWNTGLTKQVHDATGNPAGMNILGNVDNTPPPVQVWADQNKPWLNAAISRDDVIRAVSDPIDIDNVFFIKDNIPTGVFSSPQSLSDYLVSLSEASVEVSQLGFYGREIRHLFQNGYSWDATAKVFIK